MKYGLCWNSDLRHVQCRRNFGLDDAESLLPPAPKQAAQTYFQRGTTDKLIKVNVFCLVIRSQKTMDQSCNYFHHTFFTKSSLN